MLFSMVNGCHLSGISRLSQKFPIVLASPMVFTLFPGSFHLMSRLFPKSHFFLCVPWFSRCFYPISNLFSPHFQVISKLSFFSCLLPWFHAISSLLSKSHLFLSFSMVVTAVFLRVLEGFLQTLLHVILNLLPSQSFYHLSLISNFHAELSQLWRTCWLTLSTYWERMPTLQLEITLDWWLCPAYFQAVSTLFPREFLVPCYFHVVYLGVGLGGGVFVFYDAIGTP